MRLGWLVTALCMMGVNFAQTTEVMVPEATLVKLRILHPLNSKTAQPGDPLNFALAEDLILDGQTVVAAGATGIGELDIAAGASTMGRGGKLAFRMKYLRAGPARIPLRGTAKASGAAKTAQMLTWVAAFGINGLFKHGSEVEVAEGSIFVAYVDADTAVNVTMPESKEAK